MATFNLGKAVDDVQEPELMDKAWYPFEICKEPELKKNKKMENEGEAADGAGYNVPVHVVCIEESEHKGRQFIVNLALRAVGDDDKRSPVNGMTYTDQKVLRNATFARAFGGTVAGESFSISKGMRAKLFVDQTMDQSNTKLINQIAIFNDPIALPLEDPIGETLDDDDVPF